MKKLFLLLVSCFIMTTASASLEEIFGNLENGDACRSDYECQSLCCNRNAGSCAPHDPRGKNPVSCSKSSGESCVTSEFCKAEPVVTCKIIKSGTRADGSIGCTMVCPTVMTNGSCVNTICQAPRNPPVPNFDPRDCSQAVDP